MLQTTLNSKPNTAKAFAYGLIVIARESISAMRLLKQRKKAMAASKSSEPSSATSKERKAKIDPAF